jgi:phosphatidylserine synthase
LLKEKQKRIKMKKTSPLKLIRILLGVALILIVAEFFVEDSVKRWTSIVKLVLLLFAFVYGMFKSGEIEAEKIKKEKAN